MDLSAVEIVIALIAVAAGAVVQRCTGIGASLVSAPILAAIDPVFVPAPIILNAQVVGIRNAIADRASFDVGVWRRGLAGAPIGLVVGALVQSWADDRALAIAIGLLTAAAAIALLSGLRAPRTKTADVGVGAVATSFMLIAGLAGPPAAIGYAEMSPPQLRANFATMMLCITPFGFAILASAGRFGLDEIIAASILLPGVFAGIAVGTRLRPRVEGPRFRAIVLWIAFAGAVALVIGRL